MIMNDFGYFERIQENFKIVNETQGENIKKAAELILETDYRLKTSYDDSQRLLELLVLELAREASHG